MANDLCNNYLFFMARIIILKVTLQLPQSMMYGVCLHSMYACMHVNVVYCYVCIHEKLCILDINRILML